MDQHTNVIDALNALESGLRDLGLWSDTRPEPKALASTMPFCYDTLDLSNGYSLSFWVGCERSSSRAIGARSANYTLC